MVALINRNIRQNILILTLSVFFLIIKISSIKVTFYCIMQKVCDISSYLLLSLALVHVVPIDDFIAL